VTSSSSRCRYGPPDNGQAAVEVACCLPLLCLLLLGVVQVAVVVVDTLGVHAAARDGARAAAVSATPGSAASAAAQASTSLRPLHVTTQVAPRSVTVRVTFREPTSVPLIGAMLPDVTITASATMPVEPP
jgi:Flp pilus assembly protein TadG